MPELAAWKILDTQELIQVLSIHPAPDSFNAASRSLPDGVYTTLRTYPGRRILPLEDHIRRLEESARLVGKPVHLDGNHIRKALGQALSRFPTGEARIRILVALEQPLGDIYLILEPLTTPSPVEYEQGVLAVTVPLHRENPRSKQAGFIEIAEEIRLNLPPGVEEALMVDEKGRILEGLSSNFFGVREGVIFTAEEGVLPGITRALVLEAAQRLGLKVCLESITVSDLPLIGEAFLTSSSRSVLPVRQINKTVIGSGTPGPVTKRLMIVYQQEIEQKLETLIM